VYQDIFPSHQIPDRKYFLDWWVTLGKEDICVYCSKTRETKGSPDIRAEESVLGSTTEYPVHSTGWQVLLQQFLNPAQIQ